jgi:hypothetical protein
MIMTSAVEARIHAVAPESIAIHFTFEQDFKFAPIPESGFRPVQRKVQGTIQDGMQHGHPPGTPQTVPYLHAVCHRYPAPGCKFVQLVGKNVRSYYI